MTRTRVHVHVPVLAHRYPSHPMAITPAEIIQRRRAELGLTQAQLAERLGRAPSTVRRWEKGEATPPDSGVPALANALQVAPRDLAVAFGVEEVEPGDESPTAETATAAEVTELPTEAISVPVAEATASEAPAKAATAVAAPPKQRPPRRSPLRTCSMSLHS